MSARAGLYPLSRAQERMLLLEELLPGAADSMFVQAYRLRGAFEPRRLRAAVAAAATRHAAVRTVVDWDGVEPRQRLLPPEDAVPDIAIHDLSTAGTPPGTGVDRRPADLRVVGEACRDWWDTPFDISRPLFRVRVVRFGDRHLVCLCLHHMVCDGWSGRLLAADIGRAYLHGASALSEPVPSYLDYVAWEAERLAACAAGDVPFWRTMLAPAGSRLLAPDDVTTEATRCDHARRLPTGAAETFLDRPRRARLALVFHVASRALARAFGTTGRLYLGTIASGRSDPRFRSTVGPFVNPVTVPIDPEDPPGNDPTGERLAAVSRRLDQCLAHARTPFDEVVRAVNGSGAAAPFSVMVSLHDWSAMGAEPLGLDAAALRPPAPRTSAGLMLDVVVEPDRTVTVCGRWRSGAVDVPVVLRVIEHVTAGLAGA